MTAAIERIALRSAVWDAMSVSNRCGDDCPPCLANVGQVMAKAQEFAQAHAEERIGRMTPDELKARLRLAEAAAEAVRGGS